MLSGSCFCRKVTLEYSGDAPTVAICHCTDCRKLTGSPYSLNYVTPLSSLTVTGSPREIDKTADSGTSIKNYFCGDCGSPLYGGAVSSSGELEQVVVRAGVLDDHDVLSQSKPAVEIYTAQRMAWIPPVEGAGQFEGMLPAR